MDVLEAIRTRRSVKRMTDVAPSRKDVQELIDAAVWAPNHRFTQPWGFFVVAGDERERVSNELAKTVSLGVDASAPENAKRIAKARGILLQAPVVIAVTSVLNEDPEVQAEDCAATWMAIQNLTLAAWEKGIASKVRTPPEIHNPTLRHLLGIGEDCQILGLVALGYAAKNGVPPPRERDSETAIWLGWN